MLIPTHNNTSLLDFSQLIEGIVDAVDHKLAVGHTGQVTFGLFLDGKGQLVNCRAKVTYCIFSGDQFKIGYQFINPDAATTSVVNKFIR